MDSWNGLPNGTVASVIYRKPGTVVTVNLQAYTAGDSASTIRCELFGTAVIS